MKTFSQFLEGRKGHNDYNIAANEAHELTTQAKGFTSQIKDKVISQLLNKAGLNDELSKIDDPKSSLGYHRLARNAHAKLADLISKLIVHTGEVTLLHRAERANFFAMRAHEAAAKQIIGPRPEWLGHG